MVRLSRGWVAGVSLLVIALFGILFAGAGNMGVAVSAAAGANVEGWPANATGIISAEIDGETFVTYSLLVDDGEGKANSATWKDWRNFNSVEVDAFGYPNGQFLRYTGALSIEVELDKEFVQKPVRDPGNRPFKVSYFATLTNGYVLREGSVTVEEVELVDEETLRIKGSFSGTLENHAGDKKELTNGFFDILQATREFFF